MSELRGVVQSSFYPLSLVVFLQQLSTQHASDMLSVPVQREGMT